MSTTDRGPTVPRSRPLIRIADGVHRYADGPVNWYLVEAGEGLVLVDTGWPRSWSDVRAALHDLDRDVADLRAVALTHGHPDHQGAAADAQRAGIEVFAHRDEEPYLKGEARHSAPIALVPSLIPHLWRPAALRFVFHAARNGFLTPSWLDRVTTFEDGALLADAAGLRVLHTPGHTAGHASFVLEDRGILFSGDALVTLDVLTGAPGPQLLPDALNADPATAHDSLRRFEEVDADLLAPGHGEPLRGPVGAHARQAAALAGGRSGGRG